MDPLKEAFSRVKAEITDLKNELNSLKERLANLEFLLQQKNITNSTQNIIPTDDSSNFPTLPHEIKGLKIENIDISTRNKGVPTDKPTNQQTNQQTDQQTQKRHDNAKSDFEKIKSLLDSLDNIKKEIRLKFKRLTNKEMQIFSTIYSLEEQGVENITYRVLASYFNLSESSVRDYVNKLILKGIPIIKIKRDNKTVFLKISEDLKNAFSLQTIIKLREL